MALVPCRHQRRRFVYFPFEADQVAYTWAGPEIAVASTKAYTTQLVTLLLLSLYMGRLNGNLP